LEVPDNGDRNYENNEDGDDDDDDGGGGGDKDNCSLAGTIFKFREIDTSHKMLVQFRLDFVPTNCFPGFYLNVILSSLSQSSK
jgi:hypothetical protein